MERRSLHRRIRLVSIDRIFLQKYRRRLLIFFVFNSLRLILDFNFIYETKRCYTVDDHKFFLNYCIKN